MTDDKCMQIANLQQLCLDYTNTQSNGHSIKQKLTEQLHKVPQNDLIIRLAYKIEK